MKTNIPTGKKSILHNSYCGRFYSRVVKFCFAKLASSSLSVSNKLLLVLMIILCSEVSIQLNAPVASSIKLNPRYDNEPTATEINLTYEPQAKIIKLPFAYQARPKFYLFADNPELFSMQGLRVIALRFIQEEMTPPHILLKLSPMMACGPPAYLTAKKIKSENRYLTGNSCYMNRQEFFIYRGWA